MDRLEKRLRGQEVPSRGAGLITGTARKFLERGKGVPLTEEERKVRHKAIFGEFVPGLGIAEAILTAPIVEQFVTKGPFGLVGRLRERIREFFGR